jgi:mono/diheme cytochrome c family protein
MAISKVKAHLNLRLGLLLLAGGLSIAPAPASSGDAESGRVLARAWCAYCHIVEEGQAAASDIAPPFAQIANDPKKTNLGLEAWLAAPHPPMPNLNLSQVQIEDLISYIETLKTD